MKIKEIIEILDEIDPKSNAVFKLDDDTYDTKGLEIFDILESRFHNAENPDIHIILKSLEGDSIERL